MVGRQRVTDARRRWQDLWARLGGAPPDGVLDALLAAYGATDRHYHTLDHVLDCLEVLDRYEHLAKKRVEVELAIWFHDAVYDTRRDDNEQASADWSARVLRSTGVAPEPVERVERMILATRHHAAHGSPDDQLMLDIDLSILGRAPARFSEYEEQVRREFSWVPGDAFRAGRLKVLSGFLERPRIFSTVELHSAYELQARTNLATSVARLSR